MFITFDKLSAVCWGGSTSIQTDSGHEGVHTNGWTHRILARRQSRPYSAAGRTDNESEGGRL